VNQSTVSLNGGVLDASNIVTLNGGNSKLDLNGYSQSLAGLVLNNSAGQPNVTIGTGTLRLTGPIIATSSNVGNVSYISASTGGALDLNGNSLSLNVAPVTVNGNTDIANVTPTLYISAPIVDSQLSGVGLVKTGNGLLQLSASSTFSGGVNVLAGGITVGGNSNPSTVGSTVTNGPLGTGVLSMADGTTLTSTSGYTLANAYSLAGTLNFRGLNALTLNGATTLVPGATTFNVEAPQATLTLGGVLTGRTTRPRS